MENSMISTRTLGIITAEIRSLDEQAKRLVLGHAIEIGRRLVEAKELVLHGGWETYLREEVRYSTSSANNFIHIFEAYGATQQSLFGPMAASDEVGNLPYTKALALLAVPEEERESFIRENPVEDMSVRELKQAIKERDEARKAKESVEGKLRELTQQFETSQDAIIQRDMKLQDKNSEIYDLRSKVKELESRPVEVAIQRDEEAIRKAVEETEAKAAEELKRQEAIAEQLREDWKKSLDELAAAKKALQEAEAAQKASGAGDAEARAEADALRVEVEKAKVRAAVGEAKTLLGMWQSIYSQLRSAVEKLEPETAGKIRAAMAAQAKMWSEAEGV
ncbi:MAG: DUF3102 domain-containing protein [Oscillospiraceae bacterium]|nr:DUF3102 domain-containing protein [Oscillospiraceae bacterium]